MTNADIIMKADGLVDFFKIAFCVDGDVTIIESAKGFKIKGVVELNDSKRGRFYVGVLEKE